MAASAAAVLAARAGADAGCACRALQLEVETYFTTTRASLTDGQYYIGLEQAGNLWYWPDGTSAGNGEPGNGDDGRPYAHWHDNFLPYIGTTTAAARSGPSCMQIHVDLVN